MEFLQDFLNNLASVGLDALLRIIGVIALVLVGFRLAKVFANKFDKSKVGEKFDPTTRSVLKTLILWGVRLIVIVMICGMLNVPTASLIAVISSIGVTIGLALQGGLSNIAGGIMIVLFRPFRIGDCINSGSHTGVVIDIGLFYTTLRTGDNCHVVIPNGTLTGATIVNYSEEETRRVDFTFSVDYDSDIDLVRKVLLATAANHALVLQEPAPVVMLSEHGDSALVFTMRVWTKNSDYWTVNFDLKEDVKRAFDQFKISIPYPQMDVHVVEKK